MEDPNVSNQIKYKGDIYRDNRMYVMNLSQGSSQKNNEKVSKWILVTYRNTIQLPAWRVDNFKSYEESINYIKGVEYSVPLISNLEKPLHIPNDVDPWEYWCDWLKEKGLFSTNTAFQHVPYWVEKGVTERNNYQNVIEVLEGELRREQEAKHKPREEELNKE